MTISKLQTTNLPQYSLRARYHTPYKIPRAILRRLLQRTTNKQTNSTYLVPNMDDSKKKDTGTYVPRHDRTESGPFDHEAATDSDTGSSSSSSQAAVVAREPSEEGSALASESDEYDEEDAIVQNTIKRCLVDELGAEAAVTKIEAMVNQHCLCYNILRLGGDPVTDHDRLVEFCRKVLRKKREDEKQWHDSILDLKIALREEWDGKSTFLKLSNQLILM